MKIRTGFVSNSSSSSFICKIPNTMGLEDSCKIDYLNDSIADELTFLKANEETSSKHLEELQEKLDYYKKKAIEEQAYYFDLMFDHDSEEWIEQLERKIPGFKVVDSIDL